jgi:hypothetical protein
MGDGGKRSSSIFKTGISVFSFFSCVLLVRKRSAELRQDQDSLGNGALKGTMGNLLAGHLRRDFNPGCVPQRRNWGCHQRWFQNSETLHWTMESLFERLAGHQAGHEDEMMSGADGMEAKMNSQALVCPSPFQMLQVLTKF